MKWLLSLTMIGLVSLVWANPVAPPEPPDPTPPHITPQQKQIDPPKTMEEHHHAS